MDNREAPRRGPNILRSGRELANLHGLAGDLATQTVGQASLIATDLLETLPQAFLNAQAG